MVKSGEKSVPCPIFHNFSLLGWAESCPQLCSTWRAECNTMLCSLGTPSPVHMIRGQSILHVHWAVGWGIWYLVTQMTTPQWWPLVGGHLGMVIGRGQLGGWSPYPCTPPEANPAPMWACLRTPTAMHTPRLWVCMHLHRVLGAISCRVQN